jgi:septation ring formation regulator EzrA
MWKYRAPAIFIVALAFAVKTAVFGDIVSLLGATLFLSAHYADRFFGAERIEKKVEAKLKAYEDEIKGIRNDISRIGLTMGIRGNK